MDRFSVAPAYMGRTVGEQIKRLREARRMSVSELARQTGISKATLSVLENGQGNPTIETIAALAVGLRLPLSDLIQPTVPREPMVIRGTENTPTSKQEMLGRIGAGAMTEIWRMRIAERGRRIESPAHAPGTVEHILVERGSMLIGRQENPTRLEAGDFVTFPADEPHVYEACVADVEAVVIMSYPAAG